MTRLRMRLCRMQTILLTQNSRLLLPCTCSGTRLRGWSHLPSCVLLHLQVQLWLTNERGPPLRIQPLHLHHYTAGLGSCVPVEKAHQT